MSKGNNSVGSLLGIDGTKLMFGENAIHVPMWMKVQDAGKGGVVFVGASRSDKLRYGSDKCHQLIVGELIVRPHLVIGSNDFVGSGLNHLATEMDLDKWIKGDIVLDPIGKVAELLRR